MKKVFMSLVLVFISASAMAITNSDVNTIDKAGFDKLTPMQQADIIKAIASKAEEQASPGQNVQTLKEYVNIGTQIGAGLAGAAKELGVAVNDFVKTPVGQLASVVIVWKLVGHDFMHIIGGLLVWIVGFTVLRVLFKRAMIATITYSKDKTTWFGRARIESIEYTKITDMYACWFGAAAIILIAGLITIFSM